ncbi:hypothetical protein CW714_08950, partial [Methanophagales archaeon]
MSVVLKNKLKMSLKKGKGTEKRACARVSIAFVALLFFSIAALSIVPVSPNVQIDEANGTWSDSFDGANPEEGIAASTNITVADGDANLSKTSSDWTQTTRADFEAGVLNNIDTAASSGDVKLELVPSPMLIASNNTEQSVKGTTPTLVKTLTFTKSGDSYNELRIDSNLKVQNKNHIAYCDIKVDGVLKITHETQSETYVPYTDTLDFSSYADGEHTITLYLYTSNRGQIAYNSGFALYRSQIASDNTEQSVKGTTPTPVKTLTFTKSGDSYNELRIDSNLKVQNKNHIAYCDIKVDGVSKITHETQSETYVPYTDTLDFSSYADGEHTITLYLYTNNNGHHAYNSVFAVYRTKAYASSGTLASQVLDTGAAGANWTELNWSETLEADTDITFEVRASDTSFAKDASTPSWTSVGGASPVTSELPSGRYVQWRATLSTSNNSKTPTLHDVTVSYSHFNTPANLTSIAITPADLGGWSKFYADTTAPSGTSITFSILNATTNSTLISGISAADAKNGYDISSIATGNASIRLYASLNTSNASITPSLHEWNVSWTVAQPIEPPTNLTIKTGSSIELSWNGTADGKYDIYVTDDFAAGFPPVPHATVTGLSWVDTDAANHTERYYRVGAHGNGAEVGAGTVGKFDIATGSTWTLFSLPFIPEDTSINEVFGDQLTGGGKSSQSDKIWMWDGTTYQTAWLFSYPGYEDKWYGSLKTIDPDKGYWIQIRHPKDKIVVCGKVSDTDRNIPLNVGWNLVGPSVPLSHSLDNSGLIESGFTGGGKSSQSDKIWMWDGTTYQTAWLFSYPGYEDKWYGSLKTLEPGKGYWLQIRHSAFTWNLPKPISGGGGMGMSMMKSRSTKIAAQGVPAFASASMDVSKAVDQGQPVAVTVTSLTGVKNEDGNWLSGDGSESSDLVQLIDVGPDGIINPPDENGNPTGDDSIICEIRIGEGYPLEQDKGKFSYDLGLEAGTVIYCRAWNEASIEDATYYGDSDTITVTEMGDYDFGTWSTDTEKPTPTPTPVFDTGASANPYPSISGTHYGTIKPNKTITVHRLYTYPCSGTGGHTESVRIWNSTLNVNVTASWKGYRKDWHNITFNTSFILLANETYNYTIRTGSYPQV